MTVRDNRDSRDDEMAYILDGEFLPRYVGKGLGDMRYEDAVDLSVIKRKARGLPADLDFIYRVVPPPRKQKRGGNPLHTPRASINNPYFCAYCGYQSTRRSNMKNHLEKVHDDSTTEPFQNH